MKIESRKLLMHVSVATLATALFKRGLRNKTLQNVHLVSRKGRNLVGAAYTLRYIAARENLHTLQRFATKLSKTLKPGAQSNRS